MTNHVHLLMTPATAKACTDLMRDLGQRYVQYFNRRHERTGTLWEGRFRSCVAESARYVLACYRYIELNPVRACIVGYPAAYVWSSYAVNSGTRTDPLISAHHEFVALGESEHHRFSSYRALVEQQLEEAVLREIRDSTNGGYPLASEQFKSSVIEPLGWKTEPGKPGPRTKSGSGSDSDSRPLEFGL